MSLYQNMASPDTWSVKIDLDGEVMFLLVNKIHRLYFKYKNNYINFNCNYSFWKTLTKKGDIINVEDTNIAETTRKRINWRRRATSSRIT